jgi:hypothetical protein
VRLEREAQLDGVGVLEVWIAERERTAAENLLVTARARPSRTASCGR